MHWTANYNARVRVLTYQLSKFSLFTDQHKRRLILNLWSFSGIVEKLVVNGRLTSVCAMVKIIAYVYLQVKGFNGYHIDIIAYRSKIRNKRTVDS